MMNQIIVESFCSLLITLEYTPIHTIENEQSGTTSDALIFPGAITRLASGMTRNTIVILCFIGV